MHLSAKIEQMYRTARTESKVILRKLQGQQVKHEEVYSSFVGLAVQRHASRNDGWCAWLHGAYSLYAIFFQVSEGRKRCMNTSSKEIRR